MAAAQQLGFAAELIADDWQGEARQVGRRFARHLLAAAQRPPATAQPQGGRHPAPLLPGGRRREHRDPARAGARRAQPGGGAGGGAGPGRAAGLAIGTLATDGVDGPTDAAGALVTGDTLPHARALKLDAAHYLNDNDSYNFFAQAGGLLITGPTGTNVNDLMFGLAY